MFARDWIRSLVGSLLNEPGHLAKGTPPSPPDPDPELLELRALRQDLRERIACYRDFGYEALAREDQETLKRVERKLSLLRGLPVPLPPAAARPH